MIFYTFKYKTRPRTLCGIALRSFKNYQCVNPPWAWGPRKLGVRLRQIGLIGWRLALSCPARCDLSTDQKVDRGSDRHTASVGCRVYSRHQTAEGYSVWEHQFYLLIASWNKAVNQFYLTLQYAIKSVFREQEEAVSDAAQPFPCPGLPVQHLLRPQLCCIRRLFSFILGD
jgi:hypothetical protein